MVKLLSKWSPSTIYSLKNFFLSKQFYPDFDHFVTIFPLWSKLGEGVEEDEE